MNKSLNANGDLKLPALLGLGGALFSMHFGASSMVWPMNWGKESGSSYLIAFAGAFITSLLLVLFAYIAMSRGNGTYSKITVKAIGKKIGVIYSCITIIVLGPLYAIPRMSAAAWDSIVQAFGLDPDNRLMLIIFTVTFYLVTYWFLMNPGKAMDRISSLLFPILIIIVIIVVGKGMIDPIADPVPKSYDGSAFAYGFTNGYATAEILCALVFGTVIINSLKEKGVSDTHMNKNIIRVGIVGLAILTCTHFCHMWIGAHTGGTIDLTYTALYTEVAIELLGKVGGVFFCLALFFAALTTAIGMASGCAEFFIDTMESDRFTYKQVSMAILILSTIFGCLGLTSLLDILGPILDGIYPAAIVLVLYYTFMPKCNEGRGLNMCKWGMTAALVMGIVDTIYTYGTRFGVDLGIYNTIYEALPLSSDKLAWVPFAIVACVIGYAVYKEKDKGGVTNE